MIFGFTLLTSTILILLVIKFFNNKKEVRQGWSIRKVGDSQIEYSESGAQEPFSLIFKVEYYSKAVPRHAIIVEPKEYEILYLQDYDRFNEIFKRLRSAFKAPEYTFLIKRIQKKNDDSGYIKSITISDSDFTIEFNNDFQTIEFDQIEKIEIANWLLNENDPNSEYDVLEETMMYKRTISFTGEEAAYNLKNIKVSKSDYRTWNEDELIFMEIEAPYESFRKGKLSHFYSGPCTIVYREEKELAH